MTTLTQRNNPGNLEYTAEDWQGSNYSDGRFESFTDLQSGYRALGTTLRNYYRKHGINTLGDIGKRGDSDFRQGIIPRFSPSHENPTEQLIADNAARLNEYLGRDDITADTELDLEDPAVGRALMRSISMQEHSIDPETSPEYSGAFDEGYAAVYDQEPAPVVEEEPEAEEPEEPDTKIRADGLIVQGERPTYEDYGFYEDWAIVSGDLPEAGKMDEFVEQTDAQYGTVLATGVLQARTGREGDTTWEIMQDLKPSTKYAEMSDEEFVRFAYRRYGGNLNRAEFNEAIGYRPGHLNIGLRDGIANAAAALGTVFGNIDEDWGKTLLDFSEDYSFNTAPPRVTQLAEIEDVGDFGAVFAYNLGTQLPRTGGSIGAFVGGTLAAGPVGGLGSAFLYNYAFQTAEVYNNLMAEGVDDIATAAAYAIPTSLLEAIPQTQIGGMVLRGGRALIRPQDIANAFGKGMRRSVDVIGKGARDVAGVTVSEGLTEAGQELIQAYAAARESGQAFDFEAFKPRAMEALGLGAMLGFAMGGVVGGPTTLAELSTLRETRNLRTRANELADEYDKIVEEEGPSVKGEFKRGRGEPTGGAAPARPFDRFHARVEAQEELTEQEILTRINEEVEGFNEESAQRQRVLERENRGLDETAQGHFNFTRYIRDKLGRNPTLAEVQETVEESAEFKAQPVDVQQQFQDAHIEAYLLRKEAEAQPGTVDAEAKNMKADAIDQTVAEVLTRPTDPQLAKEKQEVLERLERGSEEIKNLQEEFETGRNTKEMRKMATLLNQVQTENLQELRDIKHLIETGNMNPELVKENLQEHPSYRPAFDKVRDTGRPVLLFENQHGQVLNRPILEGVPQKKKFKAPKEGTGARQAYKPTVPRGPMAGITKDDLLESEWEFLTDPLLANKTVTTAEIAPEAKAESDAQREYETQIDRKELRKAREETPELPDEQMTDKYRGQRLEARKAKALGEQVRKLASEAPPYAIPGIIMPDGSVRQNPHYVDWKTTRQHVKTLLFSRVTEANNDPNALEALSQELGISLEQTKNVVQRTVDDVVRIMRKPYTQKGDVRTAVTEVVEQNDSRNFLPEDSAMPRKPTDKDPKKWRNYNNVAFAKAIKIGTYPSKYGEKDHAAAYAFLKGKKVAKMVQAQGQRKRHLRVHTDEQVERAVGNLERVTENGYDEVITNEPAEGHLTNGVQAVRDEPARVMTDEGADIVREAPDRTAPEWETPDEWLQEQQDLSTTTVNILSIDKEDFDGLPDELNVQYYEHVKKGKRKGQYFETSKTVGELREKNLDEIYETNERRKSRLRAWSAKRLTDDQVQEMDRLEQELKEADNAIIEGNTAAYDDKADIIEALQPYWRPQDFAALETEPTNLLARANEIAKIQEEAKAFGASPREQMINMNLIQLNLERIKYQKDTAASTFAAKDQRVHPVVGENIGAIKDKILEIARKINPGIEISFAERLFGAGSSLMRSAQTSADIRDVGGLYTGEMIAIAINSKHFDPYEMVHHELFHSLEGLLTKGERRILGEMYPGGVTLSSSEHAAYAFQAYSMGKDRFFIGDKEYKVQRKAKGFFETIKRFLKQLGNFFRGLGLTDPEKIFQKAMEGDISRRSMHNEYKADLRKFQDWFRDSKVADPMTGKPIILFQQEDGTFAEDVMGSPKEINPAYLSIQNPYTGPPQEQAALEAEGYDGLHNDGVWTPFNEDQVKSIWDEGAWNPMDKRMSYASDGVSLDDTVADELDSHHRREAAPLAPDDIMNADPLINWSTVDAEEGLITAIARMVVEYERSFEKARGKMTSAEVDAAASEWLKNHRLTAKVLNEMLGKHLKGPIEVRVISAAIIDIGKALETAHDNYVNSPATIENYIELQKAKARFRYVFETFQGVRSSAGRSLETLKRKAELLNKAHMQLPDLGIWEVRDQGRLNEHWQKMRDAETDDRSIFDIMDGAAKDPKPTFMNKFMEFWLNSLLSSIKTQNVNIISNETMRKLNTLPVNFTAYLIGGVRTGFKWNTDSVSLQEAWRTLRTDNTSAWRAAKIAAIAMKTEEGSERFNSSLDTKHMKAIKGDKIQDPLGKVVRFPMRMLVTGDEFFKWRTFFSSVEGLSIREGRKLGLTREQTNEFMFGVAEAIDRRTRTMFADGTKKGDIELDIRGIEQLEGLSETAASGDILTETILKIEQEAELEAARSTFTEKLGPFSGAILDKVHKYPWLRFIMPFVMTPSNIVKTVVRHLPGASLLLEDVKKDVNWRGRYGTTNRARRDLAVARMIIGTSIMGSVAMLAQAGLITGGGPSEQNERRRWLETNQPYSIDIGGGWLSFFRIEPLGMLMGLGADLAEIIGRSDKDEDPLQMVATALIGSIAKNLTSKTWLEGLSKVISALEDPDRSAERLFYSYVGTLVPTVMAHAAMVDEPYLKGAYNTLDKLRSRLPFATRGVAPRVGVLGEPIEFETMSGSTVEHLFNPIYYKGHQEDDRIVKLLIKHDIPIGTPAKSKYRGVPLDDWQRYDLGRYRRQLFLDVMRRSIDQLEDAPRIVVSRFVKKLLRSSSKLGTGRFELENNFMGTQKNIEDLIEELRK